MPGQYRTRRISPTYLDRGAQDETYRCCRCGKDLKRYQLRDDRFGTPRLVDVQGLPCAHCRDMIIMGADEDDWK